jgi:SHS2 domain-containing protein
MHGHRFFDHTADLGIVFWGNQPGELLGAGAQALFEATFGAARTLTTPGLPFSWSSRDQEPDWVVFDWLKHWLATFHCEAQVLLPQGGKSIGKGQSWNLEVTGHSFECFGLIPLREIKAITLHHFRVWYEEPFWKAEVIVDI